MTHRWKHWRNAHPTASHILTLASGTAAAQVVVVLIHILLARIYTPEDFGVFALYTSATGVIIVLAGARYEMATMLPAHDVDARVIQTLALRIILFSAALTFLLALACYPWLAALPSIGPRQATVFLGAGVTVALSATLAARTFWLTRTERYGVLAGNRVLQSASSAIGQLLCGLVGLGSALGLMIGQATGQLLALLRLRAHTPELRQDLSDIADGRPVPTVREMAIRYRRMPLLNGPNAVVDALRVNGINILIAQVAVSQLGQFDQAWRLLQVPVALVTGAVAQVFFRRLTTVEPGQMRPLVMRLVRRAALAAIIPFTFIFLLSPTLFPLILGSQWDQAGYFARALTPWLAMTVMTSPISQVFIVTERQQWLLGFAIVYCIVPLTILYFSPADLMTTISVMSAAMALLLGGMILLARHVSTLYDRQGRATP